MMTLEMLATHQSACDTEISHARVRADANGEKHDATTSVPSIIAH